MNASNKNSKPPSPWAFDNNPSWDLFRNCFDERGLSVQLLRSWRVDDFGETRGDNFCIYNVFGHYCEGSGRTFLGQFMVIGKGPDGFSVWNLSEGNSIADDVSRWVEIAKANGC